MLQRGDKTMCGMLLSPALHFGKEPTAYNTSTVKKKGN